MKTAIRTMLFDLDGTILDTNELIIETFLQVLKDIVPPEFGREHIIPGMGLPLTDQMQRFSGLEDVTGLIAAYRDVNLRLHDDYVKPFGDVAEVLAKLRKAGVGLGIVTTKMELTTLRGLKFTGLDGFFERAAIVTLDDVERLKPHPEPVLKAMQALGAEPDSTMMIGDSPVDMEAAEAAGVIPVGVAWSLKGEQKLRESGARHILYEMRDLYSFI
ncbi:HAD-IA family hydrolase [Paenibacillus humicola]|uniref:HAD-IA family hydrolase n=1 Tax=Paenibacillus humicola TaxID=3110540 RepID=UPI00237A7654|nr:HAD-IA family hydrolase [Paenibacillus humicola]